MFKALGLLKRRAGMSREDFKAYYEQHHKETGAALLPGRAKRYFRRYFSLIPHPTDGAGFAELEFDAMVEMWFETEQDFHDAMSLIVGTSFGDYVVNDEEQLFDRSKNRFILVEQECETDLEALPKRSLDEIEEHFGLHASGE